MSQVFFDQQIYRVSKVAAAVFDRFDMSLQPPAGYHQRSDSAALDRRATAQVSPYSKLEQLPSHTLATVYGNECDGHKHLRYTTIRSCLRHFMILRAFHQWSLEKSKRRMSHKPIAAIGSKSLQVHYRRFILRLTLFSCSTLSSDKV